MSDDEQPKKPKPITGEIMGVNDKLPVHPADRSMARTVAGNLLNAFGVQRKVEAWKKVDDAMTDAAQAATNRQNAEAEFAVSSGRLANIDTEVNERVDLINQTLSDQKAALKASTEQSLAAADEVISASEARKESHIADAEEARVRAEINRRKLAALEDEPKRDLDYYEKAIAEADIAISKIDAEIEELVENDDADVQLKADSLTAEREVKLERRAMLVERRNALL